MRTEEDTSRCLRRAYNIFIEFPCARDGQIVKRHGQELSQVGQDQTPIEGNDPKYSSQGLEPVSTYAPRDWYRISCLQHRRAKFTVPGTSQATSLGFPGQHPAN